MQGLRKCLDSAKTKWINKLPNVLWSYCTSPYSSTLESSFSLCFGTEALLLIEIRSPSPRLDNFSPNRMISKSPKIVLYLTTFGQTLSFANVIIYTTWTNKKNSQIRPQTLILGDFVLRKNSASHQEPT